MFFYKKRNVNGLLLLDKPKGISSNSTLQKVKNIFNAKKAGYIGTLDPLATGILPICFGEATKFSDYLNKADKCYNVIAKLGETTSTSDSDGIILRKRPISFTSGALKIALQELTGLIDQTPSMYSAIKYNGIPLYKYARNGINIKRSIRHVYVHKIDLIDQKTNQIELNINCSKGTYIRTLIEDLGEKLFCGAHVIKLRRFKIGSLSSHKLIKISFLEKLLNQKTKQENFFENMDNLLMPVDTPICFLPKIYISIEKSFLFKLGQKIDFISNITNSLVRVFEKDNNKFIGLGKIDFKHILIPYRLLSVLTN
jgi:tRNA pseudouridine55 synthase